jgi:hypothetical protein
VIVAQKASTPSSTERRMKRAEAVLSRIVHMIGLPAIVICAGFTGGAFWAASDGLWHAGVAFFDMLGMLLWTVQHYMATLGLLFILFGAGRLAFVWLPLKFKKQPTSPANT